METGHRPEGFNLFYGVTQGLGTLLIVLVVVWLSYYRQGFSWTSNPSLQFNWHPLLMTIGMIFLYGNSILIYRAFRNNRKKKLKWAHTILHILAFVFTVIGLQAAFDSHNLAVKPIPNLYTLHSWVGLIAVILFACQLLTGFITFLYPMVNTSLRSAYLPVHVYFGLWGFVCSVAAALMGILEKTHWAVQNYKDLPPEGVLVNCIGIIYIFFASLVVYLVTESKFKRHALPEDEMLLTSTEFSAKEKRK